MEDLLRAQIANSERAAAAVPVTPAVAFAPVDRKGKAQEQPKTYRAAADSTGPSQPQAGDISDCSVDIEDERLVNEQQEAWNEVSRRVRQVKPGRRRPSPPSSPSGIPSLHSSTSDTDSDAEPASKRDCTATGKAHVENSPTARLRRKRTLNKLAWQVAEHLACKF